MNSFLIDASYWIHEFFTTAILGGASIVIVLHMYTKKEWKYAIAFVSGLIVTSGAVHVLKNILKVPRPVDAYIIETGYAMPSGHASLSFFLATFLIYYIMQETDNRISETASWIILGATAIIISASRIFLHVHTIEQVVWGAILGIGVASVSILYTRRKKI